MASHEKTIPRHAGSQRSLQIDRIWVEVAAAVLIAAVTFVAARLWTDPTDVAVIEVELQSVKSDVGEIKEDVREIRRALAERSTFRRAVPVNAPPVGSSDE